MNIFKLTKERISLGLILALSAILNFSNIGIEGYGNAYYAAGVKSMTLSLKNFFFVSFDPGSFVTIDKPPVGFWIQAISAKIFGFSGWSILLPQALAGVISVYIIYHLVKKSFGSKAGIVSALCLAVTPVFVAASRNNTIDNLLVVTLLCACVALTKAIENGKRRYLFISLILVGIGFNIKMLEAYMIAPAIYITYLLSNNISIKKRISYLVISTAILFSVSLSWALVVDFVPTKDRPYIGSSTNNSVLELIIGHNGLERLGLSGNNKGFGGNNRQENDADISGNKQGVKESSDGNNQLEMQAGAPPTGNIPGSGSNIQEDSNMQPSNGVPGGGQQGGVGGLGGGLQGSFGGQVKAGISRLFSKNSLSDQIIWFLPLALLGFMAGALREKLRLKLDNNRKVSLVLFMAWLVPEFIYFSYTTGTFHPYYLTMMAPPAAALSGIGISAMWEFYKEGKWKAWLLPIAFIVEGITHMTMLSYFSSNISTTVRNIILISLIVCFIVSVILAISNILTYINRKNSKDLNNDNIKLKKSLAIIATISILVTPFIGSSATINHSVNSTIPTAGLELLSNSERENSGFGTERSDGNGNSKLIDFLESNKTKEKYLLVVSSSQSADSMIIQSGIPIMALGGFSGSDNIITLDQFKEMVKNGEVRYVLTGSMGGRGGSSEIMNWVKENGTKVSENEYKDMSSSNEKADSLADNTNDNGSLESQSTDINNNQNSNSKRQDKSGFGGNNSEELYDLKDVDVSLS